MRSGGAASPPLTVLSDQAAPPDAGVYDQSIPSDGYGYLTTRDGTKLAINVHPPQDVADALPVGVPIPPLPKLPDGVAATPTLIEYSGYGYADPAGPQSGIAVLANLMGFTVVDVNMRGTGCSGGAFDFFEPLQSLDGYDVVETIARQPWVAHHKVGMMGISYGGISQLFTAQLQPAEPRRDLAALGDRRHADDALPRRHPQHRLRARLGQGARRTTPSRRRPSGGQPWAYKRIQEGDATCKANQALHGEAADLLAKIRANDHYVPKVADPLAPVTFVDKINVPAFMACQWTDEQTGGHCPTLAEHFTGTDAKWFTFTNGTHVDSLDPETFNRWYDFLKLYVAQEAPSTNAATIRAARAGDLPGGDGDRRRDAAARPDPAAADLRGRAGRVRAAAAGPDPVRQRRRRLVARPAAARLRAVVRPLPGARDARGRRGTCARAAGSATEAEGQARRRRLHAGTRTRGR